MISGPDQHLAGLDVDGDDHHHDTLFGEHLAITQHTLTDVADDAVDIEVAGGHASSRLQTVVAEGQHIAVLAHQHVIARHAHEVAELRVGDQVSILAVDGHEEIGRRQRQVRLDLVGLGMARGVHIRDARVDHLRAGAQQAVDHAVDVALVAGIAWLDRITVSVSPIFTHLFSPRPSNASADIGSPCEPVEITHTLPGG